MNTTSTSPTLGLYNLKVELAEKFIPIIRAELPEEFRDRARISVSFAETSEWMTMFYARVGFDKNDALLLDELTTLSEHFQQYQGREVDPVRLRDGRPVTLGDGDDEGAAWFENGRFHIWLRVWPNDKALGL